LNGSQILPPTNDTPPVDDGTVVTPPVDDGTGAVVTPVVCTWPFCRANYSLPTECTWDDTNPLGDVVCCTSTVNTDHACFSLDMVNNYWQMDLSMLCPQFALVNDNCTTIGSTDTNCVGEGIYNWLTS